MNAKVQIDEDQVRDELRSIELEHGATDSPQASGAPGAGSAPGSMEHQAPAPPAEKPPDWSMAAAGVVGIFDRVIAPNWRLTDDEQRALFDSTLQVLTAFFPDALDPRMQACMALGATMLGISQARRDPATGKMIPMRLKKPTPPAEPDAASNRAAA